jgi:hypothetical protein
MSYASTAISRVVFVISLLCSPALVSAQGYSGPKCLGPFCVDRTVSLDSLAEQLGGPSSAGGSYGYRTADQRAFLVISGSGELGFISLRNFPQWGTWHGSDDKLTAENLLQWKTSEGISLSSTEEEVVRVYGKPHGEVSLVLPGEDSQIGKRMITYKWRLKQKVVAARFGIRNGKVSLIELETDAFGGPDCLGPYCTAIGLSLHNLLGQLRVPTQTSPRPLMCLQSQNEQSFMHFRTDVESDPPSDVNDVLLSDFPNCLHIAKRISANALRAWKTPEGIGLGSSEEDVLKAYGPPSAEKKLDAKKPPLEIKGLLAGYRAADNQLRIGDKIIIYGPRELQVADFGIRDGKVSYIWLKDSDFWLKEGK